MSAQVESAYEFGTLRVEEKGLLNPDGPHFLDQTNISTLHNKDRVDPFNRIPGISKSRIGLSLEESLFEKGTDLAIYLRERYIKRERVGFLAVFLCSNNRLEVEPAKFSKDFDNSFVTDLSLNGQDWRQTIVARVTKWIDCDAQPNVQAYKVVREKSKQALEFELNYYAYLRVRAIYIELRSCPADNLAAILKHFCGNNAGHPPIWIQVPLLTDVDEVDDAWFAWYSLRNAIGSHHNVKVVLNVHSSCLWDMGREYNELEPILHRWMAEPVAAIILPSSYYKRGANFVDRPERIVVEEYNTNNSMGEQIQKFLVYPKTLSDSTYVGFDIENTLTLGCEDATLREDSLAEDIKEIVGPYSPADKKKRLYKEGITFYHARPFPKCFLRFLKQLFLKTNTCLLLDSPCLHLKFGSMKSKDPHVKFENRRMSWSLLQMTDGARARLRSAPTNFQSPPAQNEVAKAATIIINPLLNTADITLCPSPLTCINRPPPVYQDEEDVFSPVRQDLGQGHRHGQLKPSSTPFYNKFPPTRYEDEKDYNPFWMAVHRVIKEEYIDWHSRYNIEVEKGWGRNQELLPNCLASRIIEMPVIYRQLETENTVYDLYYDAIKRVLLAQCGKLLRTKTPEENRINIAIVNPCGYQLVDHVIHISNKLRNRPKCWIVVVESNPNKAVALHTLNRDKWANQLDCIYVGTCDDRASPFHDAKPDVVIADCFSRFACDGMAPEKIAKIRTVSGPDAVLIPETYGNYLCPVQLTKYHKLAQKECLKKNGKPSDEVPYVVTSDGALPLAQYKNLFEYGSDINAIVDDQQKNLEFTCAQMAELTGFLGYASMRLAEQSKNHEKVFISTLPDCHTHDLECCFPMFFPLKKPMLVQKGQTISVAFHRRTTGYRMWYEWQLTEPTLEHVQNVNGAHFSVCMDDNING